MFKISILYPHRAGARFDFGYYLDVHMARSIRKLGAHPGYRGVSVERGIAAGERSGQAPAYTAACHFEFDSAQAFYEAFLPHAADLQADVANYTDIVPLVQASEVLLQTGP